MRRKTVAQLACLWIGAILVACGPGGPRIPQGAREVPDDHCRNFGVTKYALASARQATQGQEIDETLRPEGISFKLPMMDEAWCVAAEPAVRYEISFSRGDVSSFP